ncbi:MAG: TIGR01906 family membrane protein [Eubacteriales bacterium]
MKTLLVATYYAILIILIMTGISLGILHSNDFLYTFSLNHLDIFESTGLTETFILDHYQSVMDFLNPFSTKTFSLPALTFSEQGAIHFEQCRILFRIIYLLSFLASILLILTRKSLFHKTMLRFTSICTILLPSIIGIWFAIDFDRAFYSFHLLFFPDDYWIFHPLKDPIILILPQDFFMYCGIFIVCSWFLGSIILFLLSVTTTHTSTP